MDNSTVANSNQSTTPEDPWAQLALNSVEFKIVGSIFISLFIICLIPYLIVLWIFIRDKHFNQHNAYHIMVQLGVFDILTLFSYFLQALQMITDSNLGYVVENVGGSINSSAWVGALILTLVLAFNRFDTLVNSQKFAIEHPSFLKVSIIITHIISWANFILYMIPGFRIMMQKTFYYYDDTAQQLKVPLIQNIVAYVFYVSSIILYLTALSFIVIQRHLLTSNHHKLISRDEFRLFFIAMIICGYKTLVTTLWTYYIPSNKFFYCAFLCFALLESGYHPYFYSAMNSTFQSEDHLTLEMKQKLARDLLRTLTVLRAREKFRHSTS